MRERFALFACFFLACSSPNAPTPAADTGALPAIGDVEPFAEITATEGIAFSPDGRVLYVGSGGAIHRVQPDGTSSKWVDVAGVLGIAVRSDGSLIVCGKEGTAGVLFRVALDGSKSVLATGFKQPNFVAIAADGSLVFSDSADNKVFRANADGTSVTLITDSIVYPNGVAFSRDGKTVYVSSWKNKQVLALARRPDGSYDAPTVAIDGVENVDGLAVGASGDLYLIANGLGVLRASAGAMTTSKTTVIVPGSRLKLPANGAFGSGPFGEGWLYVSNLIGASVSRVYVGEGGAPLPSR